MSTKTIDIRDLIHHVPAGRYVAFWTSPDGQADLQLGDGDTRESAEEDASNEAANLGIEERDFEAGTLVTYEVLGDEHERAADRFYDRIDSE